jgi:hypothetical protein
MSIHRLLQLNANHSVAAQDLLAQRAAERLIDLMVVTEPYRVLPNRSTWVEDVDGSVTVVSGGGHGSLPLSCLERGRGFVVTLWGENLMVGVYFSPNSSRAELEEFLGKVKTAIQRHLPRPVLVAGDLNAKLGAWSSPVTNAKDADVEEWVEGLNLLVLNRGCVPTCVRYNGESVIDITFGSPQIARMVLDWRVEEGEEFGSDHCLIRFEISDPSLGASTGTHPRGGNKPPP